MHQFHPGAIVRYYPSGKEQEGHDGKYHAVESTRTVGPDGTQFVMLHDQHSEVTAACLRPADVAHDGFHCATCERTVYNAISFTVLQLVGRLLFVCDGCHRNMLRHSTAVRPEHQPPREAPAPGDVDWMSLAMTDALARMPDNHGILMFAVPFGGGTVRHGCDFDRASAITFLKEWMVRNGAAEAWMNHID